jgi:hypothetical protein
MSFYTYDKQKRYIGSEVNDSDIIKFFFSKPVVQRISNEITKRLKGVHEDGKDIIVPNDKILWVMNTVYESYNPAQGFDTYMTYDEYIENMIGQTIIRIVYDVKNVLEYEQCMNKKTVWTTVLGDFNNNGLRSYAPIKLKNKRPNTFEFNMRY